MKVKFKVLVVDDDYLIRFMLNRYLQQEGLTVSLAESGEEAIELMEEDHFDMVITDMEMGLVNGLDVIRYIRKHKDDVVIVMITGRDSHKLKEEAFKAGADDFLLKPFNLSRLLRCLWNRDSSQAYQSTIGNLPSAVLTAHHDSKFTDAVEPAKLRLDKA